MTPNKTISKYKEERKWNRCDCCGKFISINDFDNGKAERNMVTPDSFLSVETYETYHIKCREDK